MAQGHEVTRGCPLTLQPQVPAAMHSIVRNGPIYSSCFSGGSQMFPQTALLRVLDANEAASRRVTLATC